MTLPASGPISMSQVNVELGDPASTTVSLGQTSVRDLAGIPAGTISMSDLYGKAASGSQGPFYPTAVIDFDNPYPQTQVWQNLTNIEIGNDATLAYFNVNNVSSGTDHPTTRTAIGNTFGFSIPTGKTLSDLKVELRGYANFSHGDIRILSVRLQNGSTPIGNNVASYQALGTSLTTHTFQGNATYWGTTLSYSQVNNANFGVGVIFHNNDGDKDGDGPIYYAWVRATATW